jgi:hypothetical protein
MLKAGGGGGRIVLDPVEMRRAAAVLRNAAAEGRTLGAAVAGAPRPEMPPSVAARVSSGIETAAERLRFEATGFEAGAEELVQRALWAEIAGALAGGQELEGAQLREFLTFMADGTLLVYATDAQSELAGEYLGRMFRDDFEQPARLVELARLLGPNADDADFAGGFVEAFGAENLAEVPRVIQAIEYSRPLAFGGGGSLNPFVRTDIAFDAESDEFRFEGNVLEDLLAPFSLALATATYAGTLSRSTEREIAGDDDAWAVGQLLHEGRFGTTFLLDCFRSGVVERIVEEANLRRQPGGYFSPESWPLGGFTGEGLPLDSKVLVMQALGRNPEAAALALGGDLGGVEIVDFFGSGHELHDPADLLLAFAEWEDDGRALGDTYAMALGELHEQGEHGRANELAQRLVHEVIAERADVDRPFGDAWPGLDLDGLTNGVATILADHHMDDLHLAGLRPGTGEELGLDAGGLLGRVDEDGLYYSPSQVKWIVMEMLDEESARQAFFAGAAEYETQLILEHTAQPNDDTRWARQLGFFQGAAANAYEQTALDDVAEELARQDQLFGVADGIMSALPLGKVGGFITGEALGLIQDQLAPSEQHARDGNFELEQQLRTGMVGTIAAGAHANAHLGGVDTFLVSLEREGTPGFDAVSFVDRSGGIVPFNDMSDNQKLTFLSWLESDEVRRGWLENAIEDAESAFAAGLQDN